MTFSYEDESPRIYTRVSPDLKQRLETFAERHDLTKSDVIREAVESHLPVDEDGDGPRDPDLRDTWRWLRARTDDQNQIRGLLAINGLSEYHRIGKSHIKESKLDPLRRAGWITPTFGRITVHEERQPTNPATQPQK